MEDDNPRVHVVKSRGNPFDRLLGTALPQSKRVREDDDESPLKDEDKENPREEDDLADEEDSVEEDLVDENDPMEEDENTPLNDELPNDEDSEENGEDIPEENENPEEEGGDKPAEGNRNVSPGDLRDPELLDEVGEEMEDLLVEHGTHEEGVTSADSPMEKIRLVDPSLVERRERIKDHLVRKSQGHSLQKDGTTIKLDLLTHPKEKVAFIGRKKSLLQKFGTKGGLFIGRVADEEGLQDHQLQLDSLNPHVVFVCGTRGSGKSYVLGVIAEELTLKNPDVGIIVVDPVGVFWSMKYPNKDEKEVRALANYGLMPQGLESLKVFIPEGSKNDTPRNTYDALYSIPPSLLTSEDWCLTFGMERFSPTGLVLEKALKKVEKGFRTLTGESVKGKGKGYGLEDLIICLEKDAEINSKERGFKTDSVRALVSRFEAAKGWGIFSEKGTPLSELSREGQLSVIDTSFLDDTVTALVIGILARRLLAARKIQTRKEAAKRFKEDDMERLLESEIPPTWLFIDEAHTLIPSGNVSTPASNAIVEYVKQGRRPGCSLVFATQQPSAIDTRVLSQLDVILAHKLIFDDDIKAIMKRTPTIIPQRFRHAHFLKTLPVGTALTGDRREETSRAFVLNVRPRMSQHEGRDAETSERHTQLAPEEVENLAVELLMGTIEKQGSMEKKTVDDVVQTLNQKYKSDAQLSHVLDGMEENGVEINPKTMVLRWPPYFEALQTEKEEATDQRLVDDSFLPDEGESTALLAFPIKISNEEVVASFQRAANRSMLGLGKPVEKLDKVDLTYRPLYKVEYRQFTGKTSYIPKECFVDAESGEFLHVVKNRMVSSRGLNALHGLKEDHYHLLREVARKGGTIPQLAKRMRCEGKELAAPLRVLQNNGLIRMSKDKEPVVSLSPQVDIPLSGMEKTLSSLTHVPLVHVDKVTRTPSNLKPEELHTLLATWWPDVVVTQVKEIFRPTFDGLLINRQTGEHRVVRLDG
ncbi:MAG: DUF87 domain-containing protein, partial [archaeon]|nr:DUF87 domain-containing protein [archaeon]